MPDHLGEPATFILGKAREAREEGLTEFDFGRHFDARVLARSKARKDDVDEAIQEIRDADLWPWS
jgi:hypothetical protein